MHYLGSKARHADEITAITLAGRRPDQVYVEPFVGGGNVIVKVPQGAGRIANDKNYAMVALLDAVGNKNWLPPETMTQAEWRKIMKWKADLADRPWEEQALYAFAATGPTFGSMWAGQWAKDYPGMEGTRYRQARDSAIRDHSGLRGIEFHSGSYADLVIPEGSLVYCDPPYSGTTGYAGATTKVAVGESNHNLWKTDAFWRWADGLVQRGCSVYVSEYKGPASTAFNIPATQDQKDRLSIARATARTLQADLKTPSEQITAANEAVFAIEAEIRRNCQAHVDAWKVLWEKEVVSDFSATRGQGDRAEDTGKKEVERLFHREP
jgi:DNA adenine methylase